MAHSRAGIHLDGTTACVALVHGANASVEALHIHHATTPAQALKAAAAHVAPGEPVRVCVAAPGVGGVALDVTAAQLSRRGFTRAARETLGLPDALVAGVLADTDAVAGGGLARGFATVAPADLVAEVYQVLGERHPLEVVTTATSSAHVDGLHLNVRRSTSELTLVVDGMPRATKLLTSGGVDQLVATLSGDSRRAGETLVGSTNDPLAAATLKHWLDQLLAEAAHTRTQWELAGHPVPTEVMVVGIGAESTQLGELLSKHGFTRARHPMVSKLPHNSPNQVVEAYAAGATHGTNMPYASFLNPDAATVAGRGVFATAKRAAAGVAGWFSAQHADRRTADTLSFISTRLRAGFTVGEALREVDPKAGVVYETHHQAGAALVAAGLAAPRLESVLDEAAVSAFPAEAFGEWAGLLRTANRVTRLTRVYGRDRVAVAGGVGVLLAAISWVVLRHDLSWLASLTFAGSAVVAAGVGVWAWFAGSKSAAVRRGRDAHVEATWAVLCAAGAREGMSLAEATYRADRAAEAVWGGALPARSSSLSGVLAHGTAAADLSAELVMWAEATRRRADGYLVELALLSSRSTLVATVATVAVWLLSVAGGVWS